jgi:hypothetical protein
MDIEKGFAAKVLKARMARRRVGKGCIVGSEGCCALPRAEY